jgi:hypothetical protein
MGFAIEIDTEMACTVHIAAQLIALDGPFQKSDRRVAEGGGLKRLPVMRERTPSQGFEVTVVKDATAGPQHPELGDGYASALVNFGFIASGVLTTDEVVKAMG